MTLRTRVSGLATLVVALAFLVTGALLYRTTQADAQRRLDDDLDQRLGLLERAIPERPGLGRPFGGSFGGGFGDGFGDGLGDGFEGGFGPHPEGATPAPLAEHDGGPLEPLESLAQALRTVAERSLGQGFFGLVATADGDVLALVGDEPASLPPPAVDALIQYTDEDGTVWRVRSAAIGEGQRAQIRIGADLDALVQAPAAGLVRRLLVLGGLATLLTGLVTAGVVTLATRPLGRLSAATTRVAETQDLTTRVDVQGASREIADVAVGLNTMLARLQASADAQRAALHGAQRFAADAGHELRTPLTAMQTDLDALVRNPEAPAAVRQQALADVATETRRLAGLLASMQALARADAGSGAARGPVDLAAVVDRAAQAARVRHPGVDIVVRPLPDVVVQGAASWLRSIADNLLANAAVHGRPDGTVQVGLDVGDRAVRLVVDDDGPGIPPERREAVFARFVRGADTDGRPGSGLGLSLVAQLTALHGGTVHVADSPLGGARLVVTLPTG